VRKLRKKQNIYCSYFVDGNNTHLVLEINLTKFTVV